MKNLTYRIFVMLSLALSFSVLVSCGGDDEGDGPSGGDLTGTWTVASASIDATIDGTDIVEWFVDVLGLTEAEAEQFGELFTDGLDEGFVGGTLTFNSDNTYEANFDGDSESGTWSRSGDQLTITSGGEESVTTIKTLTSSNLTIEFDETETEDIDEDGTTEEFRITFTLNLTK